ncbi:MAG: hypothetical protein GIX00_05645 [Candidatus Eremiobacteraeota bacterium]|nr:hypothetical protein [Candidatus Eremiobacteraeota bacterium]
MSTRTQTQMPIPPPLHTRVTITSREYRAPGFWCIGMRDERIARDARAAQYVALDVPGTFSVRLPLGIWTARDGEFSVLFQEWGDRTRRLAHLPIGEPLSCIGPLGNQFSAPSEGQRATIVAGGLGVAAFWLLARDLKAARAHTTIVLGARSKLSIVGRDELAALGFDIDICTDDGSEGFHGSVVDRVRSRPPSDVLYGCGPPGMLRALCRYANEAGVECQISMEENFGCSLGTCWGCVVPVRRGCPQGTGYPKAPREIRDYDFARVCADGTVFRASDVLWLH